MKYLDFESYESATVIKAHYKQEYGVKFRFYKNEIAYYRAHTNEYSDRIFYYDVYFEDDKAKIYSHQYFQYTVKAFSNYFQTKQQARKAKLLKLKNTTND